MKSIRHRLIGTYVIVILMTVFFFNVSIMVFLRQYYVSNIRELLLSQTQMSAQLMESYLSMRSDTTDIHDYLMRIQSITTAQLQIIDEHGLLVVDSLGVFSKGDMILGQDIESAIHGAVGTWTGVDPILNQPVMAVSYPFIQANGSVGVLRAITTLQGVNQVMLHIFLLLMMVTLLITAASIVVSYVLSSTIVHPIREITGVAEKMAEGNMQIRARRTSQDEIGRLADTLNHMAQELVNHERMKDEFIASISHEIRTPLTSIKGWAITLQDNSPGISDEHKEGIAIIEKESDRLSLLVEELLDFSKFAAGKISMNKKSFQLLDLLRPIQHQMSPKANRQKVHLVVKYPDSLPEVFADEDRLKQVFINLVDNAIQYSSPDSEVTISVDVHNNDLVVRVKDTGCGMNEEEITRAKQKFYKGKSSFGSGLGLSICDEIIHMHGGELSIKSGLRKGTTIIFTLPIASKENETGQMMKERWSV